MLHIIYFNRMKWEELSMKDKAAFIKVAVQNEVISPSEIAEKFNEFADGGDLTQQVNSNPFLDEWNTQRLSTGRYNDQLGNGQLELQKQRRESARVFSSPQAYGADMYSKSNPVFVTPDKTPEQAKLESYQRAIDYGKRTKERVNATLPNGNIIGGEYSPVSHAIWLRDDNPSSKLHEDSHATGKIPQKQKIADIIGTEDTSDTPYLDRPDEIYSRLMQLREANKIDPAQEWSEKDIKELKKNAKDFNILNRYKPEIIQQLFNDVALNTLQNDNIGKLKLTV